MADMTEVIEEAAQTPAAAAQDGRSATARPISDLIAADEYLARKRAFKLGPQALLNVQTKSPSATGE